VDDELAQLRARRLEELQRPSTSAAQDGPAIVSDDSFASFVSNHPIALIDVWASWCGPCRMMEPIIEELASEWEGRVGVGKLNADENYETVSKFGVQGIPAFLFFKDGKFAGRLVGARPKRDFHDALRQVAGTSADVDPSVQ
jgi:thioredoxin 1